MATSLANDYRVRKNFGKIKHIVEIPNLIEMQRESYERFLQQEVDPDERVDKGLQGVFKGVFPIRDFSGTASLEFVRYSIGRVKYDVEECLQRGMTYEAPIKITVRLWSTMWTRTVVPSTFGILKSRRFISVPYR